MATAAETDKAGWLSQLLGEWTFESIADMGGSEPQTFKGSESVRQMGSWVLAEGQGEMPGGGMGHMLMTLGYDPAKGAFVGSWVGSMMSNIFVYEGHLDGSGMVLTLNTAGPAFPPDAEPGASSEYQDIIEIVDGGHRRLRSQVMRDGQWQQFMVADYYRT